MKHDITTCLLILVANLALAMPTVAAEPEPSGDRPAVPAMLQLAMIESRAGDSGSAFHIDGDGRGVNLRHGLELAFTPEGARIAGGTTTFDLRLERFGRGDGRPVRRPAPEIDGAWVEYDRGAGLTEWFVNLPRGIEQGWTVTERPAGGGPLVLELDTGRPPERAEEGRLAWSGLIYHRLVALDAAGRELPAAWAHDGARLRIAVDDRDAAYPLLIDPWVEQAKLVADDGAQFDDFGVSVALAGDTALVGAPYANVNGDSDQGAAYVLTRSGSTWKQQAKLTAPDGAQADLFGVSLALAGDTALVGAYLADVGGNVEQGAAYVFTRSGDTWSPQAKLIADDGAASEYFGVSVALTADTALVGADYAAVGGNIEQGAAYVFTRSGSTWSQQAKLTAEDGAEEDSFGYSVALAGDTALVGAHYADVGGNSDQGAAYVFTHSGGTWNPQAKLIAADGEALDEFGSSVALAGDTALVGAFRADVEGHAGQGAAYIYTRGNGIWSQHARLTAGDGEAFDEFGFSVALAGDTALVGASGTEVDGNDSQGAAYVFTRSGATWSQQARLTAEDGTEADYFGAAVGLAGDTVLAGAPLAGGDNSSVQGAAYIFHLFAPDLVFAPTSLLFGEVVVGTTSAPLTATLTNIGNVDAEGLIFLTSGGGFEADTADCGAILVPGESCDVVVTFTPPELGPASSELLADAQGGAFALLALAGNGVEPSAPELSFTPSSLAFGDVGVGTTSAPQGITLNNTGSGDATGLSFAPLGGGFAADTTDCGTTLAAGASCPIGVTFSPAEPGEATATLQVASGEGAGAAAGLSGNGISGEGFTPVGLEVDPPGLSPEANGVFEPGETVAVAPAWRNDGDLARSVAGTASSFIGPPGAAYTIDLDAADYGLIESGAAATCLETGICYRLALDQPAVRPATLWEATFDETLDDPDGTTRTWTLPIGESFEDVAPTSPFYPAIETLLHNGVTGGCADGAYCPGEANTRSQMPAFVLRALEGADYRPPACTEGATRFSDVPATRPFCPWIEELAARGVVSGCGDGNYCPDAPVTRAQMAIFLIKTLAGDGYTPPACSGAFTDVTCPSLFADWIEELAARDITSGCTATEYCPGAAVTRAQMAVFVTRTFGLTLYGP